MLHARRNEEKIAGAKWVFFRTFLKNTAAADYDVHLVL